MLDNEGYPCFGHMCYDRGNYHYGCSSCPAFYSIDNPPKNKEKKE